MNPLPNEKMAISFARNSLKLSILILLISSTSLREKNPSLRMNGKVTIDNTVSDMAQIDDVNGDGKPDILLADKSTVQWYENPTWVKHVIAKDLTERDNVCIAAKDIDGDGKCEIAIGGQWNYRESLKDGAIHYPVPPDDRSQNWLPVKLYNERAPTGCIGSKARIKLSVWLSSLFGARVADRTVLV